jgi:hypothetical protein
VKYGIRPAFVVRSRVGRWVVRERGDARRGGLVIWFGVSYTARGLECGKDLRAKRACLLGVSSMRFDVQRFIGDHSWVRGELYEGR